MSNYPYTQISRARCKEIMTQAGDSAKSVIGVRAGWVYCIDSVMTTTERAAIKAVWETLPGNFSFATTLVKMANGRW